MQDDFNIQYAFKHLMEDIDETSTTSGVGSYQRKTKAAGKDTYKKHPGDRTTGGLIYRDLWEEESLQPEDRIYVTYPNEYKGQKGTIVDVYQGFVTVKIDGEAGIHSMNASHVQRVPEEYEQDEEDDLNEVFTKDDYKKALELLKQLEGSDPKIYKMLNDLVLFAAIDPYHRMTYDDLEKKVSSARGEKPALAENYSRFKNETKTRSKPDQFHQAIREVKKRVHEIHKVFEYVNRLKDELNESGELKYRRHTEEAMTKIKEMVNELNAKIKKLK